MKAKFNARFNKTNVGIYFIINNIPILDNRIKRNSVFGNMLKNPLLYLMILPGVVYLIIFHYVPIYGVIIAFKNFSVTKGILGSPWVGLDNFRYLFKSKEFYNVFENSIVLSILRLLWGFPVPIILAILLNEVKHIAYRRLTQTLIYIPHFISWVVIASIVTNLLSPTSEGVINYVVKAFGHEPINFLMEPKYFRSIIICSEIWKEAGWGTIIYLAAMSNIDISLYEAAIVDGIGRVKKIWYITLPGIMSTVFAILILRMGYILNNGFEQIFLLYNPLTYEVADVFETYTYRVGLLEGRFSFATAVGIFQSVVGLLLIFLANRLSRKYSGSGLW